MEAQRTLSLPRRVLLTAFRLTRLSNPLVLLPCLLLLALPCAVCEESYGIGPDWLRPSYHFTRAKFHMNGARSSCMHHIAYEAHGSGLCCYLHTTGISSLPRNSW